MPSKKHGHDSTVPMLGHRGPRGKGTLRYLPVGEGDQSRPLRTTRFESDVILHRNIKSLFAANVTHGPFDGSVTEQKFCAQSAQTISCLCTCPKVGDAPEEHRLSVDFLRICEGRLPHEAQDLVLRVFFQPLA